MATTKAPWPWWWPAPDADQKKAWGGGKGSVLPHGTWVQLDEHTFPGGETVRHEHEMTTTPAPGRTTTTPPSRVHTTERVVSHEGLRPPLALTIEEERGVCNCPACPEPKVPMPWEQESWGNPWDKVVN